MTTLISTKPISIRVNDATRAALDQVAESLGRDRSWVVKQALDEYLSVQAWQIEHIKRAMAQADAGEFASDEEVSAVFAKWGAKFG